MSGGLIFALGFGSCFCPPVVSSQTVSLFSNNSRSFKKNQEKSRKAKKIQENSRKFKVMVVVDALPWLVMCDGCLGEKAFLL